MTPRGVLETAVYADDLAAAEAFYAGVVGLPVVSREPGRHLFLRCGRGMLLVFDPRATAAGSPVVGGVAIPLHGSRGPGHVAFAAAEAELPAWRDRLAAAGVAVEAEVAWPNGGRSVYVRDPAGNSVEFATPRLWGLAEADL